jgi:hypothetical protein
VPENPHPLAARTARHPKPQPLTQRLTGMGKVTGIGSLEGMGATVPKRILDAEARRLLAEEADRDSLGTPPDGGDDRALDGGPDQLAAAG